MPAILIRDGETLDDFIRRFKRSVNKSNILYDFQRHEAFYPKSLKRKMKDKVAKHRRKIERIKLKAKNTSL